MLSGTRSGLAEQGFSQGRIDCRVDQLGHFSHWLAIEGLCPDELTAEHPLRFSRLAGRPVIALGFRLEVCASRSRTCAKPASWRRLRRWCRRDRSSGCWTTIGGIWPASVGRRAHDREL